MSVKSLANLWSDIGQVEGLIHRPLRDFRIGRWNPVVMSELGSCRCPATIMAEDNLHMTSVVTAFKVWANQPRFALGITSTSQSCSFALKISGISSSSINVLFDLSPFTTGGEGSISAARAASSETGSVDSAKTGGERASDVAVRCSAVFLRQPYSSL